MKKYLIVVLVFVFLKLDTMGQISQKLSKSNQETAFTKRTSITISKKNKMFTGLGYQVMEENYDAFIGEIGADNVALLNRKRNFYFLDFGGIYDRLYLHYRVGFNYKMQNLDSTTLRTNSYLLGLGLGYDVVNSTRFSVVPNLNFNFQSVGLSNSNKAKEIPLSTYIQDGDINLNFLQMYGVLGTKFLYKFRKDKGKLEFLTLGLEGGYVFKLNNKSIIRSNNNKLDSPSKTTIDNYYFGFSIAYISLSRN